MSLSPLPSGVERVQVSPVDHQTLSAVVHLAGDARPSANTDIVFVVDASATTREYFENGTMVGILWDLLKFVGRFDEDGVDFFLSSTLNEDRRGFEGILRALDEGREPTAAELIAGHGVRSVGQAATRADLERVLNVDGSVFGLAGVLAPALRAARTKRKANGRLFVQVVTDGHLVDSESVVAEIAEMSRECASGGDLGRFRMHILGIGDDPDDDLLDRLDSGIGDVAPVDIVATDVAQDVVGGVASVFKEMRRNYLSVSANALIEASGNGIASIEVCGVSMEEDGANRGAWVVSREQLPPELEFCVRFSGAPSPLQVRLTMFADDGAERVVELSIPQV